MVRAKVPKSTEADILLACRRRCCLCFYLDDQTGVRKGQLAHLDRDSSNSQPDNLVWLCFEHHDEYDSRSSQSKGLTQHEVRRWRTKLIDHFSAVEPSNQQIGPIAEVDLAKGVLAEKASNNSINWRFPLWQVPDVPELFAYSARNRVDGICAIERIDLPDGRIVIACTQVAGNPGQSITNAAEKICQTVCERFDISLERLIWLENYDYDPHEWNWVHFNRHPSGRVIEPRWVPVRELDWSNLGLRPKGSLGRNHGDLVSNLAKMFPWPPDDNAFD